jgi:hypothetical protein
MKTIIHNFTPPPVIRTYPHLKRSNRGCVVLFTSEKAGVVLIEGDQTSYSVGQYVDGLYEGTYTTLPIDAVVELSNEGLLP